MDRRPNVPGPGAQSLTELAYLHLEEMIVTLKLAPGRVVSEFELAELTGIGRTPIREALQRLAREHLVSILPRRGIVVSEINLGQQLPLLEERGGKIHLRRGVRQILFEGEGDQTQVTGLVVANGDSTETITVDAYVCACDVPGIQRLVPDAWRRWSEFDNIFKLDTVPVATVQLCFDGWVTEMHDADRRRQLQEAAGIDNLLYTPDADFSCFADLALTSPGDYYREGEGSLMQLVLTPGDPFIKQSNEAIAQHVLKQVHDLFPSSRELNMTWYSVVKLAQSLYREGPGMDPYRPDQKTPIGNFFLAGSYTMQDYIDSMEGATISGRQAAKAILGHAAQRSSVSQPSVVG